MSDDLEKLEGRGRKTPPWPKRAVVTAGMPYGNKGLHFGHIGGVFIPADVFARFLRDRIGADNVLFVSGTDCYGSPIDEGYRKAVEAGVFAGDIEAFVARNHRAQADTLLSYAVSLDIFEGSGLGSAKAIHTDTTARIIRRLHENGWLSLEATLQFYDESAQTLLNGRQVIGRCPVQGCKSEKAYADECDLGHQYLPRDLIAPKSTVSGMTPVMRSVANWYFDLPCFHDFLQGEVGRLDGDDATRAVVTRTMEEFLAPPIIHVKNEHLQEYLDISATLPAHGLREASKGRMSFELEFSCLSDREAAAEILTGAAIRFRTGKTLVPFRITGNIAWGVPAPKLAEGDDLTVWCWPESLWAPISFTRTVLEHGDSPIEQLRCPDGRRSAGEPAADGAMRNAGEGLATWEDFWCADDAEVYQFIGQDNIYFYCVAQAAMWEALSRKADSAKSPIGPRQLGQPVSYEAGDDASLRPLRQSKVVANHHLQFLGKKASSSGEIRPPMADELLDYYTPEQLRMHFLALGLGMKPVSFQPKPLNPGSDPRDADPVLKEGAMLTNVLNRLARSCFYSAQSDMGGYMPLSAIEPELREDVIATLGEFEQLMYRQEFHAIMPLADGFLHRANKYWSAGSKASADDDSARRHLLANAFYLLRASCLLMHSIAPLGTRMVFDYLDLEVTEREFFSWELASSGYEPFLSESDIKACAHKVRELPPRTDFFARHPSQFDQ
jgi:methionyl-tRNA synthetase